MYKMIRSIVLFAVLAVALQAGAWAGVQISWTDSEGPKTVDLTLVPATPSDPFYVGMEAVWFGTLNMVLDTLGPITLTASGSYEGVFPGGYNGTWFQVVLDQNVTNNTGQAWNGFNLDIIGGDFGWPHKTNNWNVVQDSAYIRFTATSQTGPVAPGEVFRDGISVFDADGIVDPAADFTLVKWAIPVPEAGGLAVLLGGMGGMLSYIKRRKA